jgi:putative hydrolase of the HAD superfamily
VFFCLPFTAARALAITPVMIKAVFTDMDDTLIVNMALYDHAAAQLQGYLAHFGVEPEDVMRAHADVEKTLFPLLGYSRERYPQSFENTLLHFIPNATDDMIARARGFAERVFTTVAGVKPGTMEAIDLLTAQYPVYIVTQGDRSVQQFRVSHLPFKDKLAGVFIVDKKSRETFETLTQKLGYAPEEVVMMGDSLKSDIQPAIDAGLHAVWIEAHNWSAHENSIQLPNTPRAQRCTSIHEAALKIAAINDNKTPAPARKRDAGSKPL